MEKDYTNSRMSQDDLIKILELVCKNRNTRVTPQLINANGLFPGLTFDEINELINKTQFEQVPLVVTHLSETNYLTYRDGLEEYVEALKKKIKKERLHRIVEFLSTNVSHTKKEFDTCEIAKAFTPELDIYEVNRLCEIIISNDDAIKIETDQSYAKGTLIVIVTQRTHVAYKNKRYLRDDEQFTIPIHQNISAKYIAVDNNSSNIIHEDNSTITNNAKEKPTRLYKLYLMIVVIGVVSTFSYNAYRNNKKDNEEYKLNSINYKPQLEISCQITNFQFKSLGPYFRVKEYKVDTSSYKRIKKIQITYDTIEKGTRAQYSVNIDISIKNTGNVNAILMMSSYTDTISNRYFIRNPEDGKALIEFANSASRVIYNNDQIIPQKEIRMHIIEAGTNYFRDNFYSFHFWILYRNDLEIFYDTYYMYSVKLNDSIIGLQINPESVKIGATVERNEPYTYTKEESDRWKKKFTRWGFMP
jgi:hypothetical protein